MIKNQKLVNAIIRDLELSESDDEPNDESDNKVLIRKYFVDLIVCANF